jgi:DNA-binding beta-propeller fold protein YncE
MNSTVNLSVVRGAALTLLLCGLLWARYTCAADASGLQLEAKIPLGSVRGRIDHLAIDLARRRLFIAELGNNSVAVVDLQRRQVTQTLTGLAEPQGVGYLPSSDTLYVASAGDGTVRLFEGASLKPGFSIPLGEDADNVRVDDAAHRVFVGYGSGALAVIDAMSRAKTATITLHGHPESFRLEEKGERIFVNVPDARQIAVLDRLKNRQLSSWPTEELRANFAMALDEPGKRVFAVFRHPAKIAAFNTATGAMSATLATCGDADDVYVDAKRDRLYVICGEGVVDVIGARPGDYRSLARIPTAAGARTGLFAPELDRLFVAVRASVTQPAAIWVFRPE